MNLVNIRPGLRNHIPRSGGGETLCGRLCKQSTLINGNICKSCKKVKIVMERRKAMPVKAKERLINGYDHRVSALREEI